MIENCINPVGAVSIDLCNYKIVLQLYFIVFSVYLVMSLIYFLICFLIYKFNKNKKFDLIFAILNVPLLTVLLFSNIDFKYYFNTPVLWLATLLGLIIFTITYSQHIYHLYKSIKK
jgi:hypothetical protein